MENNQVKAQKLSDDMLEDVNGAGLLWVDHEPGVVYYAPSDEKLKKLGLYDLVRNTGGFTDTYYDTYRKENDTWKNVGSDDMLKYVERTIGADDPRYQALYQYCQYGRND